MAALEGHAPPEASRHGGRSLRSAFARQQARDVVDPEIGVGEAYECGRRASARALTPGVAGPGRSAIASRSWRASSSPPCGRSPRVARPLPHEVLEALERRSSIVGRPDGPRHRFVDGAPPSAGRERPVLDLPGVVEPMPAARRT